MEASVFSRAGVRAALMMCLCSLAWPQAPTGSIVGTVNDQSGAVIPNATVTVTEKSTSAARNLTTNAEGLYSAPALPAGDYEVRTQATGFKTLVREAQVSAGNTVTVDMAMALGEATDVVNVEAAAAQLNYESHQVQGVIDRANIADLPLNGRSFMQLSLLEPGVTVSAATTSQYNALFSVSILGGAAGRTLVTLDGGIVNDTMEGGTGMNFSQDVVQEFQISQLNFDLSTGITGVGAINVVTRSGSNSLHGGGLFFYRDHNMAAYPVLKRNAFNPNPFFARRNPGFWVGGPIIKDKAFFFFDYEHMNQVSAVTFQPDLASLSSLAGVFSSPYHQNLISTRFDYRLSSKNSIFARYSHDGNSAFGPNGVNEPSGWALNGNWADQSIAGLTTIVTPTIVNDARMEYQYWHNTNYQPGAAQCTFPCIGAGFPSITSMVGSSNFAVGGFYNAPQQRTTRRYEYIDSLVWQKGTHRFKFGTDITREVNNALWGFCLQSCLSVYSPESTRSLAPTFLSSFAGLPTTVTTDADILKLPVSLPTAAIFSGIGIGTPYLPGPYERDQIKPNTRPRFYAQDTWKIRPNLTVNYGLAYEFETGLFNSSLAKPAYLAPIYGANNLGATQPDMLDFSPSIGFAWSLGKSGKTVIRGGGGIYYDSSNFYQKWREEAALGPVGNGRLTVSANVLTNIFPGIINVNQGGAALPIGAPLPLTSLTNLTLGQYIQIYNQQIPTITAQFGAASVPTSGPYTVTGIDIAKQAVELYPHSFPMPRSYQTSIGVQRDLGHDMLLTADYARRQQEHAQLGELDLNHYNEFVNSVRSPVIPVCTSAQAYVFGQECSLGAITGWVPEGRSVYNGLLVKLQKRLSHRYQFTASYAYQGLDTIGSLYNLNNYFAGYGDTLARHNLTVSGNVNLPWGVQLSVVSSILSRSPVSATVSGIDLVGTTGTSNPLPEVAYNCFNDGCGKAELTSAVASFNSTYAGKKTPNGATIPSLIVPPDYQFGDPTFSQDFRLTKVLTIKERYKFSVIAEMFNAFNIANLTGYSFTLNTVAANPAAQTFSFGQPTARGGQTFGSAGPRAVQFGGRFSF